MTLSEREKYQLMWTMPIYRKWSPGEQYINEFVQLTGKRGTVIDFGAGTGRASVLLDLHGYDVTMVDIAHNCLDPDLPDKLKNSLIVSDIAEVSGLDVDYGYCCDVMEHIPEHQVDAVLRAIYSCCDHCFFSISTSPDSMGKYIGHRLHLTVRTLDWWEKMISHYREIRFIHDKGLIYA